MEVITLIQGDEDSGLTPFFLVHAISGVALPYLRLEALSEDDDRPIYGITSPVHCPGGENFKYPASLAELAAIYLDARGEAVSKVIMIDSANPEVFPCFTNPQEHKEFAKATFEKTIALGAVEFGAGSAPGSPIPSPVLSDCGFDDYMLSRQRRASTWRTIGSDSSARSSASSLFDSPVFTPPSPRSPALSSISSDYSSEDGCDSDFEDDIEPPQLNHFIGQIKLHIHRGLQLIADVRPGDLFTPNKRSNYDVILVKCRPDTMHLRPFHQGAEFIMSVMREQSMRWDPGQFRSFETIPFSGDHDGAFAPQYVGELSAILRECLEDED
ncbi:Thioesterase pynI [Cladobotryum mycophilum]|uniref:Thioesterase pynI n=1 Tax=Cladobotryum mycophilum TaxID=491253 RepID=A0ABR0S5Q3_9HYPO